MYNQSVKKQTPVARTGVKFMGWVTTCVHTSFPRGNGEPNLGGRPGWGDYPLQLRDSAGLLTGFAFKPSHPGDMAPKLEIIQLYVYCITVKG